jgi:hypothetical protein
MIIIFYKYSGKLQNSLKQGRCPNDKQALTAAVTMRTRITVVKTKELKLHQ